MGDATAAKIRTKRSLSIIGFAVFILIFEIIGAIFLDSMIIDFGLFIVILLAISLLGKSTRAANWSIILMSIYAAIAVCLGVQAIVYPTVMTITYGSRRGGPVSEVDYGPCLASFFAFIAMWAIINLVFLLKYRRLLSTPPSTEEE